MLRLVCWRWQEGKLPLPYRFTAVGPLWQPCAPHPLQDRGEATSRRRPRNGEDGSSAWNSCRWFVHVSRRHLTIIWKTGFQTGFSSTLYICHLFVEKHRRRGAGPKDVFAATDAVLAFGTLGRMVKPRKRFQHRGTIRGFGSAPAPRAAQLVHNIKGCGFDPRFGPERSNFFAPWGYANPKTPLCDAAEPQAPGKCGFPECASGPTRAIPQLLVCGRDSAKKTSARTASQIQAPPKFGHQSPQSPHLQSRRPPHNLRWKRAGTASPSWMVAAACARASAPIKAPAPPHYPPELHQQRASPARRPRRTSYFGVAALFSNSSSP